MLRFPMHVLQLFSDLGVPFGLDDERLVGFLLEVAVAVLETTAIASAIDYHLILNPNNS